MRAGIDIKELKLSGNVLSGSSLKMEYIPRKGKMSTIVSFVGEVPPQDDACAILIWDQGGTKEKAIWIIQGQSKMPFNQKFRGHNGVKKLTLSLDNNSVGTISMSAYVKILEEV